MVLLLPAFGLAGCGPADDPVVQAPVASSAREDVDVAIDATVPDCDLLDKCPVEGVAKLQCIDDPALLRIEVLDGLVLDVSLDSVAVDTLDAVVPVGTFFTVLPDPTGGCALTIASFTAESLVPPDEDAVHAVAGGAP